MSTKRKIFYLLLLLGVAIMFYFWGRNRGMNAQKTELINNTILIKEIAELSALSVKGNSTIKVSNKEAESSFFGQLKNAFVENTLNITIPYEAKYGVDMQNQNVEINTSQKKVTIYLPEIKLLSLQLLLDSVETMNKVGILQTTSLDQYVKVQKRLYNDTQNSLIGNQQYKLIAQNHIAAILKRYYSPMGFEVDVRFGDKPSFLPD